jgi:Glycosyltransferase family 87
MPREQRPLLLLIVVLVLAAFLLEFVNGRFWLNDFRVYYSAAEALLRGDQVYGIPFGEDTGFFKYAPVLAIVFIPFALMPYTLAALIHFALIGVATGIAFVRLERLLMRHVFGAYPPRIFLRGALALLCIAVLLSRELHLGNINLWLVVGVVLATEAALEENDALAGVLFGMLWFSKPYLAFMAIPLVVAMRWRILRNAAIAAAISVMLPILALGPRQWLALHQDWLSAMAAHSGYLTSPDTLISLAWTWFGWESPMRHPGLVIPHFGLAFALLCWWQRIRTRSNDRSLILQLWTAFALVPHLVITDQEHFLYSLPLLAFILGALFRRRAPWLAAFFLLAMLGYATRSSDLWGSELESRLVHAGALGAGNLLLVVCVWALRRG